MKFDPKATLRHIGQRLLSAPRETPKSLLKQFRRDLPSWTKGYDLIRTVYDNLENTVRLGEVRWAAVIQANEMVFVPGPHTCGAQIVYDASGGADLEAVITAAEKCFETKHGRRRNDEELKLGSMLADEMERAVDWPIPPSIAGDAEMYTSIVMLPRENMPYRFMALTHYPVLADPTSRLVAFVPPAFWDEAYLRAWKRAAIKAILTQKLVNESQASPLRSGG